MKTLIFGAGPAGLTAAHLLTRSGLSCHVLEKSSQVGGISRTERHEGYCFDIGGHRFYTKVPEVFQLWKEVLGERFLKRSRLSRIHFDGSFFDYPLCIPNALGQLGVGESVRIGASYVHARFFPRPEDSFEDWVVNRFGERLYRRFFQGYTEKVWGLRCTEIRADWAAQRIRGLSLMSAAANALHRRSDVKSLIRRFHYPEQGPGMMWEAFARTVTDGGNPITFQTALRGLEHDGRRILRAKVDVAGEPSRMEADHFLSSIPLKHLVLGLDPAPPEAVQNAARALRYRDFIQVGLVVDQADIFPDNWIYVHTPGVRVGRIQNFKNWSPAMVPRLDRTSLGMEYFCSRGDDLWDSSDARLAELARLEVARLGLADPDRILDAVVIRQPRAYPVYDEHYQRNLAVVREYLSRFINLQTMGRNGLHRYNNQDHSMLTAIRAVENIQGADHDLWEVNTERSYQEEFERPSSPSKGTPAWSHRQPPL